MRRVAVLLIAAVFAVPSFSSAQDTPRFGVVMGYPAAVGVLWNVADRLAVRPQLTISKGSGESTTTTTLPTGLPSIPSFTTTTTSSSSSWSAGVGVSALVYLTKGEALRTYVCPGFTYSRSSTTIESTVISQLPPRLPTPQPTTTPSRTVVRSSNYTTTGSFGAQYALGTRFGLFGELGLDYVHSGEVPNVVPSSTTLPDASNWSLGVRSGVGVILFFGK
jgi:hypothetical protein